jgi:hypothetical protein
VGCGQGKGKCTVEGLTVPGFPEEEVTYGGILPHDNSGSMKFVSVRHAGDEIGDANELNGVTLAGVGDATVFENIEVYANQDDGIEWFGGTVNGRNLHVLFAADDTFDVDLGYTGINQFLFGIMPFFNDNDGTSFGSRSGDKAGEWDGDEHAEGATFANIDPDDGVCKPFSNPNFYNVTIIGSTPDAGQDFAPTSAAAANTGIQMRNGFGGELLNTIVVNTGTSKGLDVTDGDTGCPGFDTATDNAPACLVKVIASTFQSGGALDGDETTVLACGDADPRISLPGGSNNVNNVRTSDAAARVFNGLVNEDTTFNPQGNAAGKLDASLKPATIDPRPAAGPADTLLNGVTTGPDTTATYRGAFNRTTPPGLLWADGWTVLGIADLIE